jgi:hypothetical protein
LALSDVEEEKSRVVSAPGMQSDCWPGVREEQRNGGDCFDMYAPRVDDDGLSCAVLEASWPVSRSLLAQPHPSTLQSRDSALRSAILVKSNCSISHVLPEDDRELASTLECCISQWHAIQ